MSKGRHEHGPIATAGEVLGGSHTVAEMEHASHAAHAAEASHVARGLSDAGPPDLLAPFALANGINTMVNGESALDKVQGGLETVAGGVGTVGLLGTALTTAGATGAGGALGTAATALGPAGAVAGAGAAGLEIGKLGNEGVARRGWLGKDENGKARDWSDWFGDKVFPGGSQFSPVNVTNAGPLLVSAGIGAAGTAAVGLWDKIWGNEGEEEEASAQEVVGFRQNTRRIYEQMLQAGQSRDVALMMARNVDPGFQAPGGSAK